MTSPTIDIETRQTGHAPRTGLHGPELTPAAFERICAIARRIAGLAIADGKSAMIRTRLARRLRALGLSDYDSYCDLLESPAGAHETINLISALTTNVSHFFREEHHFEILRNEVLPTLRTRLTSGNPIRLWSAGCANGQEPYSIAMSLAESGISESADCLVLASDIDPQVIETARHGAYPELMMAGVSASFREAYFTEAADATWQVTEGLKDRVRFRVLNLLEPWPMRGLFDVVFCRNVVIYFDKPTQARLWARFAEHIRPGGWLFLGHSERIDSGADRYFEKAGVTAYRRTDRPAQSDNGGS